MPNLTPEAFVSRWSHSGGSEVAHRHAFFLDLCDLLDVPRPPTDAGEAADYRFEKAVHVTHKDGIASTEWIDAYRKDCFVLEFKQGSNPTDPNPSGAPRRGTNAWSAYMRAAFGQVLNYANCLPEGRPPFLMTCDVGYLFEVWTGFTGDYGGYGARRTYRIEDFLKPEVRSFFRAVFLDPKSLDDSRRVLAVTQEVAMHLARLAKSLEEGGHDPEVVAKFLMRCLFTMFAEDVDFLPDHCFARALRKTCLPRPEMFPRVVEGLWMQMNHGGLFGDDIIRKFNGGLFDGVYALPLDRAQIAMLLEAADRDWSDVEPAIFGTLLEQALKDKERSRLGAHFTPREYIERLVVPTVMAPLREEWNLVQAQVADILRDDDDEGTSARADAAARKRAETTARNGAIRQIETFHQRLLSLRFLDPACGTGNFLYVTLDLVKRLESEVLRFLSDLGQGQTALELHGRTTVSPSQFLGIEKNPRAREIADLVLWLGHLQWFRRNFGDTVPPEPILRAYGNIECRDAVLSWSDQRLKCDERGVPLAIPDPDARRTDPVTGRDVPDPTPSQPVYEYVGCRPAEWPRADFIVSNPPFIGGKGVREAFGDDYARNLWALYPEVGASADFVMYWWHKAANLVRQGFVRRFGFITTNSITQVFDRRTVAAAIEAPDAPLALAWAIPDHPWVSAGADVRIAMTVGCRPDDLDGLPVLGRVTWEAPKRGGEVRARDTKIDERRVPRIHADLSGGADVTAAVPLMANAGLCSPGVKLHGAGFIVTPDEAKTLGLGTTPGLERHIRPYRNGRDLASKPRDVMVIDLFGLTADEARARFPAVYQWVLERVKPEREGKGSRTKDAQEYASKWWLFGKPRQELRAFLHGLPRYIATVETSKHRWFTFLDPEILPDNMLVNIGIEDAWVLGVLSSRFHVAWALAAGALLEDRPRYSKTQCFDPFPFPEATEPQRARIGALAEAIDAQRKSVQAANADAAGMTAQYNALVRLREATSGGPPLTGPERDFHVSARIGVLRTYHDELDAAVADAYGWPADLPDDEVLVRLVALNRQRADEEARGVIRHLRPDFQAPGAPAQGPQEQELVPAPAPAATATGPKPSWPQGLEAQIKAVRDAVAQAAGTVSATDIADAFRYARIDRIRRHLETLESLGLLAAYGVGDGRRYSPSAPVQRVAGIGPGNR